MFLIGDSHVVALIIGICYISLIIGQNPEEGTI